jgi:hypothetical protein
MKTVRMRMFEKVPTRDAATRDILLTPPSPQEFKAWAASIAADGANLGTIWTGALEPILDGLDPAARKAMLARIAVYGEMRANDEDPVEEQEQLDGEGRKEARGALDSAPLAHLRPDIVERAETCEKINDANNKFWAARRSV